MDSVTYRNSVVASAAKSLVFVKINAEKDTLVARKYGVTGYPTIVLTRPNGVEIDRMVGYYSPEQYFVALLDVFTNRNTLDDLLSKLIRFPDSVKLYHDVAENYMYKSNFGQAVFYYNAVMDRDPQNARGLNDDAWYSIATIYRKQGKTKEAVEMFGALPDKFPKSELVEDSKLMIPYTYQKNGEPQKALKLYEQFKRQNPQSKELEWVDKQIATIKNGNGPKK